jgi:thiamine-monophosphate kinase
MPTIGELGERGLIRLLRRELMLDFAGDDAAVLPSLDAPVITVDSYLEGVHFHRWWCPPETLGRRVVEATLSDLAATGAEPLWLFAAVCLPPELDAEWLLRFYRGLTWRRDCRLAGGETIRGEVFGVTLTAVGNLRGAPMKRSSAVPGERLWVTGPLGRTLDAPALLEKSRTVALTPLERRQVELFLNPAARFDAMKVLLANGCSAAIDISDGLLSEAWHIAEESRVRVLVDSGSIPLVEYARKRAKDAWVAGEDYEILFTAGADRQFPGFYPIGEIREGEAAVLTTDGCSCPQAKGYDHFRE